MRLQTIQTNTVRVIAIAGLSLAISSKATVPISDLPDFDNLDNFAQLGNQLNNGNDTINGNSGVSEGGLSTLASLSTINGNVYVGNGATFSNSGHVTGSTFTGQDLTTEQNTVFSASEGLDALTPDQIVSSLQTGSLSFNVPAGQVYVVDLNGGLSLNSANITLTGTGLLVLNILGSFNLGGTASILGNASNIFINYLGSNTGNSSQHDVIDGQVFIPNASANLGGTWNGGIFSGNQTITMLNAATINAVPIPEPGTMALAATGGLSILLLRLRFCLLKH